MTKINQEEYELLKSFDDKWKWIARDRGGVLWIYEDRPEIFKGTQTWDDLKDSCVYLENDLFQFIQWEDEEPYNIAELIEEYEGSQMTYFDNKLVKEFDNFIEESKEAEVRKGIEWLKEEVWKQDIIMDKGYIYTDDLMSIINEVDEPEIEQLDRKMKELESYNDELIRDNNQLRNELDNQEILSQEWIERNTSPVDDEGRLYVWKSDLQNAIVPKQELPAIPKFVADYIVKQKAFDSPLVYVISQYLEDTIENKVVTDWIYENFEVFVKAWLDGYEVKELENEQKYIVSDNSSIPLLIKNDSGEIMSYDSQIAYNNSNGTIELTEQEIKDYDERYMNFAVKVEELE